MRRRCKQSRNEGEETLKVMGRNGEKREMGKPFIAKAGWRVCGKRSGTDIYDDSETAWGSQ